MGHRGTEGRSGPARSWSGEHRTALRWFGASVLQAAVGGAALSWYVRREKLARERLWAAERRYRRLADAGVMGLVFWDADGAISEVNSAFAELVGHPREAFADGTLRWRELLVPEVRGQGAARLQELQARGWFEPYETRLQRADGETVHVIIGGAALDDAGTEAVSFVVDVTERVRLQHERDRLLEAERAARAEAQTVNQQLQLVAAMSAELNATLDPGQVLDRLCRGLVPALGPLCAVFLPEGDAVRCVAAAFGGEVQVGRGVPSLVVPVTSRAHPLQQALATRQAQDLGTAACAELFGSTPVADECSGGAVAVPLRLAGEVLAVLFLARPPAPGALGATGLLAVQEIADRAATALRNARSYAQERGVGLILQRALMPVHRPAIADHDLGACYVPAAMGREIGGDWWDVLALRGGHLGVVVGDAAGHGIHVASVMARLRHGIDALLTIGASPAEAISAVSELLESTAQESCATAFVAVYDPASRVMAYSRAGHPAPVVLAPDGTLTQLDRPGGTLIGVNGMPRDEHTIELPEGFVLVAYTDGLVERRGVAYDDRARELREALRRMSGEASAQAVADRLVAEMVGPDADDDVCAFVLRHRPAGSAG